jgi:hypothetical protein
MGGQNKGKWYAGGLSRCRFESFWPLPRSRVSWACSAAQAKGKRLVDISGVKLEQ